MRERRKRERVRTHTHTHTHIHTYTHLKDRARSSWARKFVAAFLAASSSTWALPSVPTTCFFQKKKFYSIKVRGLAASCSTFERCRLHLPVFVFFFSAATFFSSPAATPEERTTWSQIRKSNKKKILLRPGKSGTNAKEQKKFIKKSLAAIKKSGTKGKGKKSILICVTLLSANPEERH